jgi:hypothetical protein
VPCDRSSVLPIPTLIEHLLCAGLCNQIPAISPPGHSSHSARQVYKDGVSGHGETTAPPPQGGSVPRAGTSGPASLSSMGGE